MRKSVFKIIAATALFAGVHSLLATRAVKKAAIRLLGERRRNALYRPFYNSQAVITFAALVLYGVSLPDRDLYRASKPLARLMRFGQLITLVYLLYAARQIGFLRFAGAPNLAAWLFHEATVPVEPEGQGPILDSSGRIKATGPFCLSRHPLNFAFVPLIWLMPRMTVNLAVFNSLTTIYAVAGSIHEEKRLREAYGEAYAAYQRSGINFFVPSIRQSSNIEPHPLTEDDASAVRLMINS